MTMQSFGMTLLLQDDAEKIRLYRELHERVWPVVTDRIRSVGIDGMEIFLIGRRLFMYMTATDEFDPAVDFARLDDDPEYRKWSTLTASLQAVAPEAGAGEWWARMDKVFDLGWPQHLAGSSE
jgi:L-rhamnose mutarotase